MNAKQILMDIANELISEFPNVKMYFQNNLEDYDSCLKNAGYDSDDYTITFHNGKIHEGCNVFVCNYTLSKKPNIIFKSNILNDDYVYMYIVK